MRGKSLLRWRRFRMPADARIEMWSRMLRGRSGRAVGVTLVRRRLRSRLSEESSPRGT